MSCGFDIKARTGETLSFATIFKDQDGNAIDIANDSVVWQLGSDIYASPSAEVAIGPEPGVTRYILTTAQVATYGISIVPYTITITDPDVPAGQGDLILLEGIIRFE